jgi:hypothetical protein
MRFRLSRLLSLLSSCRLGHLPLVCERVPLSQRIINNLQTAAIYQPKPAGFRRRQLAVENNPPAERGL